MSKLIKMDKLFSLERPNTHKLGVSQNQIVIKTTL